MHSHIYKKRFFLFGGIILTFPGFCRGNLVLFRPSTSSHCEFKSTKAESTETSQRDFGVGFSIYVTSFEMFFSHFFSLFFFFFFNFQFRLLLRHLYLHASS